MKKYTFPSLLALLLVALVGCKDYLDVNTNPNAPSVTVPDLVLSGALTKSASIISVSVQDYATYWAGYWSASGNYSPSGDFRRYFNLTTSTEANVWLDLYLNAGNYRFVEDQTKGNIAMANYTAIAKIMQVYDMHTLVDNYGNVPYSTALQGFSILSPTYDNAADIYKDLSNQLDTAIAIISSATAETLPVPPTSDLMFGGDMAQWAKLANTMNLRLLIRQSGVSASATVITSEIAKINTNGKGFLTTDAKINPGYAKAQDLQNPFWETDGLGVGGDVGGRNYDRVSAYSVSFFCGPNYPTVPTPVDPRANRLFRAPSDLPGVNSGPSPTNPYVGIPFGANPDAQWQDPVTSAFGVGILGGADKPIPFLTAAQSYLLQAEAVERGGSYSALVTTLPSAQALFEAGVSASFAGLGVPSAVAAAATYYNDGNPLHDYSAATDKIQAIIVQKWAANWGIDAMEAWSDVRRTGFPDDLPLSQAGQGIVNPTPPVRLLYPVTEFSNNASAVAKELKDSNFKDQFQSKIFWDVN